MFCFIPGANLTFRYTYRGDTEERHVKFIHMAVGTVGGVNDELGPFPEPTIFLHASDYDREGAPRSFALNLIDPASIATYTPAPDPTPFQEPGVV
jgi:hypothetical protein